MDATHQAPKVPISSFKRTKIIATVGPATHSYESIRALIDAGANGIRLNFSHGTYDERLEQIAWIRKAARELGKPVAIIQDLQGPKIRLGEFEGIITIKAGQHLSFVYRADYEKTGHIPTQYDLSKKVKAGEQQNVHLPVALCGFSGVYYTITDKAIAVMRDYAEVMPVIAFPHMGQEYQAISDEVRRGLYRKMIDNGADVVLGNHPHWVQPSEVYKGSLITYSLGNFIFDQQFSQEVMRSAAIDILMTLPQGSVLESQLRAWVELGESCRPFHDDCLSQAQAQGLRRLPVNFSFNVVGVDTSNQITKRAKLHVYNAILERLDWANTQELLQSSN